MTLLIYSLCEFYGLNKD